MALGLLLVNHTALACGPYYYSAADNRIYRFLPPTWKPKQEVSFATKNIKLWAKQTGCTDTTAIREAIYRGTLADWEWASKSSGQPSEGFKQNAFVRHLRTRHDQEAIDLLYQSKEYECLRNQMRSPWYYNSRVSDEQQQMETLHRRTAAPEGKYLERQAFLGLKCAWAAGADSTVLALWERHKGRLNGSIFRDEAEDYVARSLERTGRKREADAIYERLGRSRRDPDSEANIAALQEFLSRMDYYSATGYPEEYAERVAAELRRVQEVLQSPTLRHRAEYLYAAACMLDYLGRPAEGLAMLQGVQGDNAFLRKALRTLTFHLRSKVEPVGDDLVDYAVAEVQWLCGEMEREWRALSDDDRQQIRLVDSWGSWYGIPTLNKMYSYAALRRTLLADSIGLCYRMAAAGYGVRALQMANVADNYLFQLTDSRPLKVLRTTTDSVYWIGYEGLDGEYKNGYLAKLRDTAALKAKGRIYKDRERFNDHDYSNGLFCLADAMEASTLEAYRQRMLHPQDQVDRWMNARSYTGTDYWQDIIGTHYLRERNYSAAVSHLRHVSPQYQQRMNISDYCQYDPFGIDRTTRNHDLTHYKLHFAERMDSLGRTMLGDPDPDRRGLAMLEYSIGLENSFDRCWALTSYGHSSGYWEEGTVKWPEYGRSQVAQLTITYSPYAVKARAAVKQLRDKALRTLRTDDARARYHLRLGHYTTVRQRYADTPTARHLALVCDNADQHKKKAQ